MDFVESIEKIVIEDLSTDYPTPVGLRGMWLLKQPNFRDQCQFGMTSELRSSKKLRTKKRRNKK